jgi:hypothetical protein
LGPLEKNSHQIWGVNPPLPIPTRKIRRKRVIDEGFGLWITQANKYFFRELNSTIFNWFWAVDYYCVLGFFPSCQVSEKKKFFITVFEFIRQFFFQNEVFQLQEVLSELEIRVFLENGLGSFQTYLILQIWDNPEVLKRFLKQFWKLDSKPNIKRILLFSKIPCCLFPKSLNKAMFSVYEIWKLSQKPEVLGKIQIRSCNQ